jgi:hypothetical protein
VLGGVPTGVVLSDVTALTGDDAELEGVDAVHGVLLEVGLSGYLLRCG